MAACCKINNRKAPVSERDAGCCIYPPAFAVRTAVLEGICHLLDPDLQIICMVQEGGSDKAGNSAHNCSLQSLVIEWMAVPEKPDLGSARPSWEKLEMRRPCAISSARNNNNHRRVNDTAAGKGMHRARHDGRFPIARHPMGNMLTHMLTHDAPCPGFPREVRFPKGTRHFPRCPTCPV